MSTTKERFIELLPRVGIAAETIVATTKVYTPCIKESYEMFCELMKGHHNSEEVFTPEEIQLIENANTKLESLEKVVDILIW